MKINDGAKNIKIICSDASLANEHNIAYKAADLFFEAAGVSADISINIEKNIPRQAGLGGGSSDGASVLLALNEYFENILPENILMELAAKTGADVPFFVKNISCAICEGIGEKITPVNNNTEHLPVLIVKPVYNISTKQAFDDWDNFNITHDFKNDFSALAFEQNKKLREIYDIIRDHGAIQAELTGSGSALFGIFENLKKARGCENFLKSREDINFCGIFDFV
jgi:4-diphosphocytidyl-2-C-methyl-D-erythritol kinase